MSKKTSVSTACVVCGKTREVPPSILATGRGKYCSRECYWEALKTITGEQNPRYSQVQIICAICGKPRMISLSERPFAKYCSQACARIARRGQKIMRAVKGVRVPKRRGKTLQCLICGKEYYANTQYLARDSKYCSSACSGKASELVRGPAHPLYRQVSVACDNCGKVVFKKPSWIKKHEHIFCSRPCLGIYNKSHQYKPSQPEVMMARELTRRGVEFTPQFKYEIGIADFYISPNIIIECDGDYWHKIPKVAARDKSKDKALGADGFSVLRFWEKDINANPAECVSEIRRHL